LKNTGTGEERVVRKGEVIDGWRVMEIAETHAKKNKGDVGAKRNNA
jgi:hypothetical protein